MERLVSIFQRVGCLGGHDLVDSHWDTLLRQTPRQYPAVAAVVPGAGEDRHACSRLLAASTQQHLRCGAASALHQKE
jgi:hypothetical protein